MIISRDMVSDSIGISKLIVKENLAQPTMPTKADNEKYNSLIKPEIDKYTVKHGNNPRMILQQLLKEYVTSHNIVDDFEAQGIHYWGRRISSYVWAAITKKDKEGKYKGNKISNYPQLYVLINSECIKFGLCYGNYVYENSEMVKIVKDSETLQQDIMGVLNVDPSLKFYDKLIAADIPSTKNIISVTSPADITDKWSSSVHLTKYFQQNNIPGDIESEITKTYDKLLKIFLKMSGAEIPAGGEAENHGGGEEGDHPLYSVDDILSDGCFLGRAKLETILKRLRAKKNIILQGPPGTGKTWLATRLAYALIGRRDDRKVKSMQFHPNLSYEDFIRGWRPGSDGKLSLIDGPFMEMISKASGDPSSTFVVVIEEINRGNPAQIFGEMLTLLEVDRRTPAEALELCYRKGDDERVYIPNNLYVVGTMNIADRSLAIVDFALRRRFAFINLEPQINKTWREWVCTNCGLNPESLIEIEKRILALNDEIASDTNLGKQFCIGHSFITPPKGAVIENTVEWFKEVIDTEIGQLLEEYWFDSIDKARSAKQRLLAGL